MFSFRRAVKSRRIDISKEGAPDLLAEREMEEFEATVRASRKRAEAGRVDEQTASSDSSEQKEDRADEIEWADQEDVFQVSPIDARVYLAACSLDPPLSARRGESLVLVRKPARDTIQAHLASDLQVELGGLLGGQVLYDSSLDLFIVVVEVALPALYGESTAISFSYTPEAWEAILPIWQQMPAEWTIVGSYHSHPGLGVFLSSTDRETQGDIFLHDWQIALVVDPVANKEGYFIGISGKPCRWAIV